MTNKQTRKHGRTQSGAAFEAARTEALRRLRLVTAAVTKMGHGETVNWGHVGNLDTINGLLKQVGHYAGIEEFVEK